MSQKRTHSAEFKARLALEAVKGAEDGQRDRPGVRGASGPGARDHAKLV